MAKKETVKKTTKKANIKKVAENKTEITVESVVENEDTTNAVNNEVEEGLTIAEGKKLNYEELYKENKPKIKKENNERDNTKINHLFGYLWNGQEMDY